MARNRTVKDKARRRLTPAARVSPNPVMSDKRRSETKTKPAKKAAKPAAAGTKVGGAKAAKPAVAAAAKIKARLKSKVAAAKAGAAEIASPPAAPSKAKRPTARAEGPVARPRLRRRADGKRSSTVSSARFAVGDVVRHRFIRFAASSSTSIPCSTTPRSGGCRSRSRSGRRRSSPTTICSPRTRRPNTSPTSLSRTCCRTTTGLPVRHPQILG